MIGKNITRTDLVDAANQRIGLSRSEAVSPVEQVSGGMCDTLANGETVKLFGSGNFVARSKGERIGRNLKTGVEVPMRESWALTFRPSNDLTAPMSGEAAEGDG